MLPEVVVVVETLPEVVVLVATLPEVVVVVVVVVLPPDEAL